MGEDLFEGGVEGGAHEFVGEGLGGGEGEVLGEVGLESVESGLALESSLAGCAVDWEDDLG